MDFEHVYTDWLSRRKITQTTKEEFQVKGGVHPKLGECIVIPVHNEQGFVIFNKYRRSPLSDKEPKYVYDQGGSMTLYGAWKIKDKERVLWCEGELDCLVAWSANVAAVSSTGGAMSVDARWKELLSGKEVIICFDNDKAGGEGMVKALEVCPKAKVLFLPDRPGVKDISDYVASGGDLEALLKTAISFESMGQVKDNRSERVALWKSTYFHDAYLRIHEERPRTERKDTKRFGNELERAKQSPIDEMIEFRENKARCPFHAEKESSLHLYRDQNRVWCFGGCGRGYDAVDVYMKLNGASFKDALKKLS